MREQLDGRDVGIGIGDAPRHHGAGIRLRLAELGQSWDKEPAEQQVGHQPDTKRRQQPGIEPTHHQADGHEINDQVHEDVSHDHPRVTHGQRRLHDLGGHATGKLVLVETQALRQHVAMENPTQPHGEVGRERLLLDQRLRGRQHDTRNENASQQQQVAALARPQLAVEASSPANPPPVPMH